MAVQGQADWAGGIFRAPGGPDGTVYDAINALVTDDHDLLKRGGVAVKASSDLPYAIAGLWDGYLIGGQRTVMLARDPDFMALFTLDSDDTTVLKPSVLTGADHVGLGSRPIARGVGFLGIVFWPYSGIQAFLGYAGSRKTAEYTTGTVTVTLGSKTVTGVGTSFAANADVGMFLRANGHSQLVASVDSNTQLTLVTEWTYPNSAGAAYSLFAVAEIGGLLDVGPNSSTAPLVLAAVNQRLVYGQNGRVRFSLRGDPFTFAPTDFWDLPAGTQLLGADAIHDTCVLFTTNGVWTISNMDFDLTDDEGNVQQQLAQISKDVILWGEAGIDAWAGALVVPALDDVYLLDTSGPQGVISEGIRPLYRSYVHAGYRPGIAAVHRGHYFLPILDQSNNVVDTLVCRLDLRDSRGNTRPGWTRWSDGALAAAWAVRASTGAPKLLAAYNQRLREATDAFTPAAGNKQDPGPTTFNLDVTTRDFDSGNGNRNTLMAAKLRYELVDAASDNPTIAASYSEGPEGSAFTALTGPAPENDGTDPFTWRPVPPIRTRRLRLRFVSSGPSANLKIRVLELLIRSSSRL
jgi:hypothetical protein